MQVCMKNFLWVYKILQRINKFETRKWGASIYIGITFIQYLIC